MTRAEYLEAHNLAYRDNPHSRDAAREAGAAVHQKYYAQFATPSVMGVLHRIIGGPTLLASTDPAFNDIVLRRWDQLPSLHPHDMKRYLTIADVKGFSLSDKVCIYKAAARVWVDQQQASS